MPTPLVKKYAEEKGVSVAEAEGKWERAKEEAKSSNVKPDSVSYWKIVTTIFKKMMGV